jgi:redox-sensitive bicupin YhaK (pirin superfamily)
MMMQKPLSMREVLKVYRPGSTHMVGDGFHVRNLFPSNDLDHEMSPFLLLDYAGPTDYAPTSRPRGVGEHPHRGFETVTIVYQGGVDHRDSAGNTGTIGPGDLQWMTAGSGVVHEEKHQKEFAQRGGTLQMIQLWVNLPKASKMTAPRYQTLLSADIPVVSLDNSAGTVRVIAGQYTGKKGPAKTFTPVLLYDMRLRARGRTELALPSGQNAAVFVLSGQVTLNESASLKEAELAVLGRQEGYVVLEAKDDATIMVLAGKPIDEPVARYGPFVMNTREELVQAVEDYRAGKMGHLD